tara:strand:- start:460 stop:687 length:228 start_codon:yes stop_codon:yes gene_type:complete
MVGGLLKKISGVNKLRSIKSSNPTKKQLEDFYKRWQKENKISSGTLSEEGKKKQVKKFVDIRKRTKATRQKKKFD